MLSLIKPAPILLTFATMFGVFVHDMNIDKAAKVATAPPAAYASVASAKAIDEFISRSEHTHVERASIAHKQTSSLPKVQPPKDDERKYVQNKKQDGLGGDDQTYIWPSV